MTIELQRLTTPEQIAQVAPLRASINIPGRDDVDFAARELAKDAAGYVFAFLEAGALIGTMRCIPFDSGQAPLALVARDVCGPGSTMLHEACEMGRLVLVDEHRGSLERLGECFRLMGAYMHDATPYRRGFTMGTRALARLYKRLGCLILGTDVRETDDGQPLTLLYAGPETLAYLSGAAT